MVSIFGEEHQVRSELRGHYAVIAGDGTVGLEIARTLAAAGAAVALVRRDAARLSATQASGPGVIVPVQADYRHPHGAERLGEVILDRFGRVDMLFLHVTTPPASTFWNATLVDLDQLTATLTSAYFPVLHLADLLADKALVVFGIDASPICQPGRPLRAATLASLDSLARDLRDEPDLKARDLRVYTVQLISPCHPASVEHAKRVARAVIQLACTPPICAAAAPADLSLIPQDLTR